MRVGRIGDCIRWDANHSRYLLGRKDTVSLGRPIEILRCGGVISSSNLPLHTKQRQFWWMVPLVVFSIAYATFPAVGQIFHSLVLWISEDSWLPKNEEQMNLLSNVVTQVVNGPVVTSISVLFATLMSVTISTLHNRQQDVQLSLISELEALKRLESLVASPLYSHELIQGTQELREWIPRLQQAVTVHMSSSSSPHEYITLQSIPLLLWCDEIERAYLAERRKRSADPRPWLSKIRNLVQTVQTERKNRWVAVTSMHFPMAHYFALALLVASILAAFLVTTDEADFIFLHGLQVRLLWSVLVTCFTSLAVVCADLADAFSGAYTVAPEFMATP